MSTAYVPPRLTAPLHAVVDVPGSKSIANRALVCAALADGTSRISQLPDGDDSTAMLDALAVLGTGIRRDGPETVIDGGISRWSATPRTVDAQLAGTTSRFLTALAALSRTPITIDGAAPLRGRPMAALHEALSSLGATVSSAGRAGSLPVTVSGLRRGGTVAIPGHISSQFLSALMLVGPYLEGGLTIKLTSALISRPYVAITAAVMDDFGHRPAQLGETEIVVAPGRYRPTELTVETDASSASYPLAAAAIVGGRVAVRGLQPDSRQGDARFVALLTEMGASRIDVGGSIGIERIGPLHGITVDMADISDLVPTLAAVALFAQSPTVITGVGFIRGKESDRLGDLATELSRLGADVNVTDDGLRIAPASLHGARLGTHHDHRLAMAFGVIGLAVGGVEIEDPGVVSKSWPQYWAMIEALR